MVLAAGAGYGFSAVQQKTYEARTTLIVGQSLTSVSPDYSGLLASEALSTTYAVIATTRPQLEAAIAEARAGRHARQLAQARQRRHHRRQHAARDLAQDSDPARAAAIANTLATHLIAETTSVQGLQQDRQAAIDADLAATQEQIAATQERVTVLVAKTDRTAAEDAELATLEGRLVTLRSAYATLLDVLVGGGHERADRGGAGVRAHRRDRAQDRRSTCSSPRSLGLLLARRHRRCSPSSSTNPWARPRMSSASSAPRPSGSIGQMKGLDGRRKYYQLAALLYPRSAITEAYRTLRANIEFAAVDTDGARCSSPARDPARARP